MGLLVVLVFSSWLGACGGGAIEDNSSNSSISLSSFSLTAATVSTPSTGTVNFSAQWSASASGLAATAYSVSAYAIPASSSQAPSDATRFLGRNCSAIAPCSGLQTLPCTFSANKVLSCSFGTSVALDPGAYKIIAQACSYDTSMNPICSSKETSLTII